MKKALRKILLFSLSASTAAILAYAVAIYGLALLPKEKLIGRHCLPEHLKNKLHADYVVGKNIPFAATSACFVEPPIQILGTQTARGAALNGKLGPKPVPPSGSWQLSLVQEKKGWPIYIPYFAITRPSGLHFRIGCRWDDVNHYYMFPSITIKKVGK